MARIEQHKEAPDMPLKTALRVNNVSYSLEAAKAKSVVEYTPGKLFETTSNFTHEMVTKLLHLAEINTQDPRMEAVARKLLPMTRISAALFAAGHPDNTPLYISHVSCQLEEAVEGKDITTHMEVIKAGKTSVAFESVQIQNGVILNRGIENLLADPWPFVPKALEPNQKKPEQTSSKEPEKLYGPTIPLPPITITQEKVNIFARDISHDTNPAHLDPTYMQQSRFHCGTISHGMLPGIIGVLEAVNRLNETAQELNMPQPDLDGVSFSFQKPIVVGQARLQPEMRLMLDAAGNPTNSWEIVIRDEVLTDKEGKPITYIIALIGIKDH